MQQYTPNSRFILKKGLQMMPGKAHVANSHASEIMSNTILWGYTILT